jgi:hypothetical protein
MYPDFYCFDLFSFDWTDEEIEKILAAQEEAAETERLFIEEINNEEDHV